jgi:hypothetical protein
MRIFSYLPPLFWLRLRETDARFGRQRRFLAMTALPSNNRIGPGKRYDSIGSAPAQKARVRLRDSGRGTFDWGV